MDRRDLLKSIGLAGPGVIFGGIGARSFAQERHGMALDDETLGERLELAAPSNSVAGTSVAYFENGQLSTVAMGVCNIETGVPLTTDSIMHIGSNTKVLNATLVMQLVDDGLLDLDELVTHYLPSLQLGEAQALRSLTVKMLLNHTCGVNGELLPDFGPDKERIADAIARFSELDQLHNPGQDFSYSNAGAVIAGYLCEVVRGRSWYELVQQRIFDPLDMEDAIADPTNAILHRASVGHVVSDSGDLQLVDDPFLPHSFAPAGATVMMSASDLMTFARTHMRDGIGPNGTRILSEQSARLMRTETARYQIAGLYSPAGLGWLLEEPGIIHHAGGGAGTYSALMAHPQTNSAVAILCNTGNPRVSNPFIEPFMEERGAKPFGPRFAELVARVVDEPVQIESFLGHYENSIIKLEARRRGDQLEVMRIRPPDTEWVPSLLRPISGRTGTFLAEPEEPGAIAGVWAFVNPDATGRTQHMASGMRLWKRTS